MLSGRKSALSPSGAAVCVAVSGRSLTGLETYQIEASFPPAIRQKSVAAFLCEASTSPTGRWLQKGGVFRSCPPLLFAKEEWNEARRSRRLTCATKPSPSPLPWEGRGDQAMPRWRNNSQDARARSTRPGSGFPDDVERFLDFARNDRKRTGSCYSPFVAPEPGARSSPRRFSKGSM